MFARIRRFIAAPVFEDEDRTRVASLLNIILLAVFFVAALIPPVLVWVDPTGTTITLAAGAVVTAMAFFLWILMRRGHVQTASLLLTSAMFVVIALTVFAFGVTHDYTVATFFLIIFIAGLLMGGRAAIIFGLLSMLVTAGVFYAEVSGVIVPFEAAVGVTDLIILLACMGLTGLLLRFAVRSIAEGFEHARRNAQAVAKSNQELEASRDALQVQTSELGRRARYLEATAEVARNAASMLDQQELLSRAVTLVSEQFGFYHAGIFLLDGTREYAVLRAASSEGGQRMLECKHRLRVGQEGIVGYVTGQGQPRIALDVGADAVFFDNPDLPETRSEMALPLRVRGEIIGALDVQSPEPAAFSDEDVAVLQTLADQLAVAISNADLYQQAQESLEVERRAYGEFSRQSWKELLRAQPNLGFHRRERGISPAGDVWHAEMETALQTGQTTPGGDSTERLATPIKVRGHVIGVIDAQRSGDAAGWTREQIALLEALADQVGMALESARLYQEAQRRASREQLTREITSRMRETLDTDTILQVAVREIGDALGLHDMTIRLEMDTDRTD